MQRLLDALVTCFLLPPPAGRPRACSGWGPQLLCGPPSDRWDGTFLFCGSSLMGLSTYYFLSSLPFMSLPLRLLTTVPGCCVQVHVVTAEKGLFLLVPSTAVATQSHFLRGGRRRTVTARCSEARTAAAAWRHLFAQFLHCTAGRCDFPAAAQRHALQSRLLVFVTSEGVFPGAQSARLLLVAQASSLGQLPFLCPVASRSWCWDTPDQRSVSPFYRWDSQAGVRCLLSAPAH